MHDLLQAVNIEIQRPTCGLWRRLAAMAYDLMLLIAVLFIYTLIVNILFGPPAIQGSHIIYPLSLLLCCYGYFVWQWQRGGQTLGMKAWRLVLVRTEEGTRLDWRTATTRFLLAGISILLCGAGLWWTLFDPGKRAFYDRYAGTNLVTAA